MLTRKEAVGHVLLDWCAMWYPPLVIWGLCIAWTSRLIHKASEMLRRLWTWDIKKMSLTWCQLEVI